MMKNTTFEKVADGVFINNDPEGLAAFKARKNRNKKVDEMSDDINTLKEELAEIKDALKILIQNRM